ncbi:DUF4097 family beta strand repeat-containing protein [Phytomonospora sp. NPDC050363]|uniref:DUF4097 family beta strand repeat-containing protein n=1 Tax=Phytomonospora sp. NPDC050363 TaxID=3155642 RepID=UPI0033C3FB22
MSEPKDQSSKAIILIGLVVLGLLIAGGLVVWGATNGFGPRKTETQNQTYAQTATHIDVDSDSGEVEIRPGNDGEVKVERKLEWYSNKPTVNESWDGTTFKVVSDCSGNCGIDYIITVPPSVSVKLQIDSGNAKLRDVTGTVDATLDSGDLEFSGLSNTLNVTMSSGNLDASQITSKQVTLGVSSGDLSIAFAEPPTLLDMEVDSGGVDVKLPVSPDGYRVITEVSSGDTEIGVERNDASTHEIKANVDSGDVQVSST